jgi:hypothetical protein
MLGSVWFVLAPWLAFGAGVIFFYVWPRRSPRTSRPQRSSIQPNAGRRDSEQEADPDRHTTTS